MGQGRSGESASKYHSICECRRRDAPWYGSPPRTDRKTLQGSLRPQPNWFTWLGKPSRLDSKSDFPLSQVHTPARTTLAEARRPRLVINATLKIDVRPIRTIPSTVSRPPNGTSTSSTTSARPTFMLQVFFLSAVASHYPALERVATFPIAVTSLSLMQVLFGCFILFCFCCLFCVISVVKTD